MTQQRKRTLTDYGSPNVGRFGNLMASPAGLFILFAVAMPIAILMESCS